MAKLTEQNRQISNDITATNSRMSLTKSKQRIADHGKYSPRMDGGGDAGPRQRGSERIDSRFWNRPAVAAIFWSEFYSASWQRWNSNSESPS